MTMLQLDFFGPPARVESTGRGARRETAAPRKPRRSPREVGLDLAARATRKAAAEGFDPAGARAFVVDWLRRFGPTSGEELVRRAIDAGFRPRDARSFGGVFLAASRLGEIECVRSDLPRLAGHGMTGGKLWRATR